MHEDETKFVRGQFKILKRKVKRDRRKTIKIRKKAYDEIKTLRYRIQKNNVWLIRLRI